MSVAKKRLPLNLQFLHSKMEFKVDFIGGDLQSAFSTFSDVFSDPEFSAPSFMPWGLGALDEQHRECTGFPIMPKRLIRMECGFAWLQQT